MISDNAYQRVVTPSASPAHSAVQMESNSAPIRRRLNSFSKYKKIWSRFFKPGRINIDRLVRMRLRWRTVAKVLGGILFFKVTISILAVMIGSDAGDDYVAMGNRDSSSPLGVAADGADVAAAEVPTTTPVPTTTTPPPIPPPTEAIMCETLRDYASMVETAPEVDSWQTIQLGISFGYSAYYDNRLSGVASIRVMGLADEWLDAAPPICQLWFEDRVEPFALKANVTNFPAQPTARYKSVMYSCSYTLVQPDMPPPVAVSMSSEACAKPLGMFKVHVIERDFPVERRHRFTVCLASPMRLNYSDPGQMVDWIEVHKLFGVTKFVMYDYDTSASTRPFMQYYIDRDVMEVIPWTLPQEIRDPRGNVKAFGHLTTINDCLYRNMYKSKYLVYLDLDEMMVPRGVAKTLDEALVTTSCQDKAQTIIRSAFFRKQWTNDEKYAADERMVKRNLISLLKTKRERKVLAINVHAKYIVIPEQIESLEALAALRFIPTVSNLTGEATCVLLAKECLLHHYRYYDEFMGDWMVDRKMHEFTKMIVERTGQVFDAVEKVVAEQQAAAAAEAEVQQETEVVDDGGGDQADSESPQDQDIVAENAPPAEAPVDSLVDAPAEDTAGGAEDAIIDTAAENTGVEDSIEPEQEPPAEESESPDADQAEADMAVENGELNPETDAGNLEQAENSEAALPDGDTNDSIEGVGELQDPEAQQQADSDIQPEQTDGSDEFNEAPPPSDIEAEAAEENPPAPESESETNFEEGAAAEVDGGPEG